MISAQASTESPNINEEILQRLVEEFKLKMNEKIAKQIVGIAMESVEGGEDVMVNLGSGFLFMDNPCGEVPLASGIPIDDFKSFSMPIIKNPPIRHQEVVNYKCCGCSRFFGSKDWPRCPHCGAEAGAY